MNGSRCLPKIDRNDIMIMLGLAAIGGGLFEWLGLGQALVTDGAILLVMGLFGGVRG